MKKNYYIIILILIFHFKGISQQVSVSPQIDVHNDTYFNLIGQIDDKILTFRSKNDDNILNVFDKNLNQFTEKKIFFEKKKIDIISISQQDSNWILVYSYQYKNKEQIKAYLLNKFGNKLDSINLHSEKQYFSARGFAHIQSEDESKLLLFKKRDKSTMDFIELDVKNFKKMFYQRIQFNKVNLNNDFRNIQISNEGNVYLVFEKSPTIFNKFNHKIFVYSYNAKTSEIKENSQILKGYSYSLKSIYDNKNKDLKIVALTTKSLNEKAKGYLLLKFGQDIGSKTFLKHRFNRSLLSQFYKLQNKKEKGYIKNLAIKELVLRNDGGLMLMLEKKEIITRQNMDRMRNMAIQPPTHTEYIFSEIVVISLQKNGDEFWNHIMPKYQVSSNDFGIYSSYFNFKTPSSLKIIFNDEIKDANQVMMYTLNPLGSINRKSLFATELYKLNLAFEKSIQISNSRLLVPSYKKDRLKLVLIEF